MCVSELATPQTSLDQEESNTRLVKTLYEALRSRDVDTVHRLLTPDLEWWFHGPPTHQHLMRLLTGSLSKYNTSFTFNPLSIVAFGSTAIAEGYDELLSVSWVHAWTVTDGILTQVREYFNTYVTVTRFVNTEEAAQSISSPSLTVNCQSVWQSKLCDNKSVPGLVLAL